MYPRQSKTGELVQENQLVTYREHLLRHHRLVFLSGALSGETESHNLLMALDTLSHDPIKMVITSPGGDLDFVFLFYDTMRLVKSPIITIGRYCASGAAIILAAGAKRYLFPHSKVMLHLPSGQMGGDARDWEIQHREMQKYKDRIVDILCECGVKKNKEEVLADIDRNFWLEPAEAISYGLCDEIITPTIWSKIIS